MSDTRSLDQLFATATDLTHSGSAGGFADWTAVETLHKIGSREVLTRAIDLTTSQDVFLRGRGLDILAQLGQPQRTFPTECLAAIVRVAENDNDAAVLCSAAHALGHFDDASAAPLARLAQHGNPEVRYSVARSLEGRTAPEAVAVAVGLTKDADFDVRFWAMYALRLSAHFGSAEAREALVPFLDDAEVDLRDEAICGLARSRDPRVVAPLIKELRARPHENDLAVAACWFLGLPENADAPAAEELIKKLEAAR